MNRSRLGSLFVFVFVVLAFTVAAPSVEQPTRIHGGEIYRGSNNTTPQIGNPLDYVRNVSNANETNENNSSQLNGSEDQSSSGFINGLSLLATVAGVLLLALVVGSVFAFYRTRGTRIDPERFAADSDGAPEVEDDESKPDPAAVGTAAGRAAEHIEDDAQNAVYRAWREMTALLDLPDPAVTTPGEFADEAITVGMNPEDVGHLTDLFEEVRYGNAPVTADRKQRARDALRRIESRYEKDEP